MKSTVLAGTLVLLAFTHAVAGFAQNRGELGVEVDRPRVITVEVLSVDKARRLLRLTAPQGEIFDVTLRPEASDDMESITEGDTLRVTYHEMITVYIDAPGAMPNGNSSPVSHRHETNDASNLLRTSVETVDETAQIIDVYPNFRKINLRLNDGRVKTISVDPSVAGFEELKPNMIVHARLTRSVAVSVFSPDLDQ